MRRGGMPMGLRRWLWVVAMCSVFTASAVAQDLRAQMPKMLPWSQQIAVREGWLVKRHAMLLDMMRRHKVDMWIVVNEEFHDDPLTEYIAPARPYTGNRDFFVFVDAADKG